MATSPVGTPLPLPGILLAGLMLDTDCGIFSPIFTSLVHLSADTPAAFLWEGPLGFPQGFCS